VRKTFLQHAIESKNAELANRSVRQIEAYDPLNIDFGERLLPELRKAGQEVLADEAFDRLMDCGAKHIERFGTDATALNNLAWTAAMNERQLDQALQLSKTAVMLEPDSVVFRDTLAEVLHLLGRTDQALEIESACLLDETDEWHIHEQVAKYRKLLGRSRQDSITTP
jgi:predicted Zn-dependent protease